MLVLNPVFYIPFPLVGLLLHIPSSMDGESDNTQFIRGSSGHTVAWFSIVRVVVWMAVPQQICPLEPVMWPYFEKAFLQTELSEGFRDETIWVTRVHPKSNNSLLIRDRREDREDPVKMEGETGVMLSHSWSNSGQKRKGRILLWSLWRERGPADTLFQTSSLQNGERTNFCCFKKPSLW